MIGVRAKIDFSLKQNERCCKADQEGSADFQYPFDACWRCFLEGRVHDGSFRRFKNHYGSLTDSSVKCFTFGFTGAGFFVKTHCKTCAKQSQGPCNVIL